MPNRKGRFQITYFKKIRRLITLAGWNGRVCMKEVTEYSLKCNVWRALPSFPFGVASSSICILKNEWLYNLGGAGSKWSVGKLALTGAGLANPNKWKEVKLSNYQEFVGFKGYRAEVIGFDQIVFFGNCH